jgi:hypothetical protein
MALEIGLLSKYFNFFIVFVGINYHSVHDHLLQGQLH